MAIQAKKKNTKRQRGAHGKTPKPDPIYAAIAAHKAAWAAFGRAVTAEQKLERALPAAIRLDEAKIVIGERPISSETDLKDLRRQTLAIIRVMVGPGSRKQFAQAIDANIKGLRRKLAAENRALKRAQDKSGWTAINEQWNAMNDAEGRALLKLCKTRPTTLPGLAALAAYAGESHEDFMEGCIHGEDQKILETISKAATRMGRTV